MRKWWALAGCALAGVVVAWLTMPRGLGEQPPRPPEPQPRTARTVTASGTGTVKVKPDTVRVTFGVQATGTDPKAALEENEKKARKIQAAVSDLKVPQVTVVTEPYRMNPGEATRCLVWVENRQNSKHTKCVCFRVHRGQPAVGRDR